MKGACVFWIPAIYHQLPTCLKVHPILEDEDISDEVGLSLELAERFGNVWWLQNKSVNLQAVKRF